MRLLLLRRQAHISLQNDVSEGGFEEGADEGF